MQRFKQPNMDLHPDGEWIRYEDHVEAMKRIAGAPVAQGLTDEQIAQALDDAFEEWGDSGGELSEVFIKRFRALLAASPADQVGNATAAVRDVLAERRRHVEAEGWTPEHDDDHSSGDLARAAGCYALYSARYYPPGNPPGIWPWAPEWWKPAERRRNLVKAAALLLAELERIDRAAMSASKEGS